MLFSILGRFHVKRNRASDAMLHVKQPGSGELWLTGLDLLGRGKMDQQVGQSRWR